jgi:hypothetical protein
MKNVLATITGAIIIISAFLCWHEHRLQKIESVLYSAPEPPTDLPKPPHPIVPTMPQGWIPAPSKEALIKYLEVEADKKMVDEEITRINQTLTQFMRNSIQIDQNQGNTQRVTRQTIDVLGKRIDLLQESIDALKDMDNRIFEGYRDVLADLHIVKNDIIDLKKAEKE